MNNRQVIRATEREAQRVEDASARLEARNAKRRERHLTEIKSVANNARPERKAQKKVEKAAPPMKPWFLTLRSGRIVDTTGRDTKYNPTKGWRSTRLAA